MVRFGMEKKWLGAIGQGKQRSEGFPTVKLMAGGEDVDESS
jgi:hypothetical protein